MALDDLPPSVGLGGSDALPMFLEEQDDGWRVGPEAAVTLDKVAVGGGVSIAKRSTPRSSQLVQWSADDPTSVTEVELVSGRDLVPAEACCGLWVSPSGDHALFAAAIGGRGARSSYGLFLADLRSAPGGGAIQARRLTAVSEHEEVTAVAWVVPAEPSRSRQVSHAVLLTSSGRATEISELGSSGRPVVTDAGSLLRAQSAGLSSEAAVDIRDAVAISVSRSGGVSGRRGASSASSAGSAPGAAGAAAEVLFLIAGRARQTTLLWQYRGTSVRAAIAAGPCSTTSLACPTGQPPPPSLRVAHSSASSSSSSAGGRSGSAGLSFALLCADGVMIGDVDTSPAPGGGSSVAASRKSFLVLGPAIALPPLAGIPGGDIAADAKGSAASSAAAPRPIGAAPPGSFRGRGSALTASSASGASGAAAAATAASSADDIRTAARAAASRALGLALTPLHVFVVFKPSIVAINRRTRAPVDWVFEVPDLAAAAAATRRPEGFGFGSRARSAPRPEAALASAALVACVQDSAMPAPPRVVAPDRAQLEARRVGIFAHSAEKLVRVLVLDEARDEWKGLVRLARAEPDPAAARELFAQAAAESRSADQRAWVTGQLADWLIDKGCAEEAAQTLARTSRPFESVVLRFAAEGATRALIRYATEVLDRTEAEGAGGGDAGGADDGVAIQRTVLSTWLLELHLAAADEAAAMADEGVEPPLDERGEPLTEGAAEAAAAAHIDGYAEWMHAPTALSLVLAHGRERLFDQLCREINTPQSWDRLVSHCLQRGAWKEAVDVLESEDMPPAAARATLARVAPTLARRVPGPLLDLWEDSEGLRADDMLSALQEVAGAAFDAQRAAAEAEEAAGGVRAVAGLEHDALALAPGGAGGEEEDEDDDANGESAAASRATTDAAAAARRQAEAAAARAAIAAAVSLTAPARAELLLTAASAASFPPLTPHELRAAQLCLEEIPEPTVGGMAALLSGDDDEAAAGRPSKAVVTMTLEWLVRRCASQAREAAAAAAVIALDSAVSGIYGPLGKDVSSKQHRRIVGAAVKAETTLKVMADAAVEAAVAAGDAVHGDGSAAEAAHAKLLAAARRLGGAAAAVHAARRDADETALAASKASAEAASATQSGADAATAADASAASAAAADAHRRATTVKDEATRALQAASVACRRAALAAAEAGPDADNLAMLVQRAVALYQAAGESAVDIIHALRQCTRAHCRRAAAELFAALGMWPEAVNAALSFDVASAKAIVRRVQVMKHSSVFRVGDRPMPGEGAGRTASVEGGVPAGLGGPSGTAGAAPLRNLSRREHRELVRSLWLRVAEAAAAEASSAHAAMLILQEANDPSLRPQDTLDIDSDDEDAGAAGGSAAAGEVLAIDDILPLLPDGTLISAFKKELVAELKRSSADVDRLKADMDAFTRLAEQIRAQTTALRSRTVEVRPGQACLLCGSAVAAREFYVFATGNAFHRDCLVAEVRRGMGPVARASFDKLLGDIVSARAEADAEAARAAQERRKAAMDGDRAGQDASLGIQRAGAAARHLAQLVERLDAIVAAEDPLTGEAMISSVAKPLDAYRIGGPSLWASLARTHADAAAGKSATTTGGGVGAAAAAASRLFRGATRGADASSMAAMSKRTTGDEFDLDGYFEGLDWAV
ncbi:hypothetical protein FNF28_03376 [Cafeteria roenbergensis]|uniref:Pep3/Vps18 RING C-terminal domain-containing protein n=1 Tax=Cafeteria roenbergensis TaxID=33653 RepID=A0A5A8DPN2_CAFRO|nr:hypothetical protein FNF28_03376 [Cafeteria roenbergensis]